MLKGEVFGRQLLENQIFALFINTFLNGNNGVCSDYLNGMAVTYSGNNVTIDSGAVCIQGRFLEEDTSTTLDAGNSNLFCKLVSEIDLDKINTEDSFNQGYYKIVTDSVDYPSLTQTNIVGTNSGIYQYELARFKTSANGITDFQDMRTTLSIPTIYDDIRQMVQDAIDSIEDGSAFALKTELNGTTLYQNSTGTTGTVTLSQDISSMKRIRISGYDYYGNTTKYYFTFDADVLVGEKFGLSFKSHDGESNSYYATEVLTIGASSITRGTQLHFREPNIERSTTSIYITKVIGFNY